MHIKQCEWEYFQTNVFCITSGLAPVLIVHMTLSDDLFLTLSWFTGNYSNNDFQIRFGDLPFWRTYGWSIFHCRKFLPHPALGAQISQCTSIPLYRASISCSWSLFLYRESLEFIFFHLTSSNSVNIVISNHGNTLTQGFPTGGARILVGAQWYSKGCKNLGFQNYTV